VIRDTLLITRRGLYETWHQKKVLLFLVAYPLLFMIIFGSSFGGESYSVNVDMAIVQPYEDITDPLVQEFIKQFENIDALTIEYVVSSDTSPLDQAKDLIENKGIMLVMFLPDHLMTDDGSTVEIPIFYDDRADLTVQSIALGITEGVIDGFSSVIFEQKMANAKTIEFLSDEQVQFVRSAANPFLSDMEPVTSSDEAILNYIDFLIPGLVAMSILWTATTGVASSIVEDRVKGIRRRILSTPASRGSILLGYMLSHLVVILLQIIILLFVAAVLYNLNIVGSLWLMFLIIIVGTFSMISIGLVISTVAKTSDEASQLAMLVNFPMMFLSGIFFPIPEGFMSSISKIFPLTYVNDALRDVMVRGNGFSEVSVSLAISVAFTIFFFAIGIMLINRGEES